MKIKELRQQNEEDLNKKVLEVRQELLKLNAQVSSGAGAKNPGQLRQYKKTIARIKTILKERQNE